VASHLDDPAALLITSSLSEPQLAQKARQGIRAPFDDPHSRNWRNAPARPRVQADVFRVFGILALVAIAMVGWYGVTASGLWRDWVRENREWERCGRVCACSERTSTAAS
jgi:hypothetical protein